MKKIIALVLALSMALCMGVTAFAADWLTTPSSSTSSGSGGTSSGDQEGFYLGNTIYIPVGTIADITNDVQTGKVTVGSGTSAVDYFTQGYTSIGIVESSASVLTDQYILWNSTDSKWEASTATLGVRNYWYGYDTSDTLGVSASLSNASSLSALEKQVNFSSSVKKGQVKSISFKLVTSSNGKKVGDATMPRGTIYAQVELKDTYNTTKYDTEFTLKMSKKGSSSTSLSWTISQDEVTYASYTGDVLDINIESGENWIVNYADYDTTREDYKITAGDNVTIEYKNKVVESGKKFWGFDEIGDTDILDKYESANLQAFVFYGNTKLAGTATVKIESTLEAGTQYLYTLVNGELAAAPEGATYNKSSNTWTFETRTLGAYYISEKEIDIASDSDSEAPSDSDASSSDENKSNPDTGVGAGMSIAVIAAVASLAAAAVALKK